MKYIRSNILSKVLAVAALAATSLSSQHAFADSNRLCAVGERDNCYLTGNFAPELAQGFGFTTEISMVVRYSKGVWSMGGQIIGTFGGPDWRPVVGDWNGDGYDNIGLYKKGTWVLKDSWNFDSATMFSDITWYFNFGGPNWLPITGDWNNNGIDSLGVYKDGSYRIQFESGNAATERMIRFGNLPYDETSRSSAYPIVGSFDNQADRVGLIFLGSKVFYATSNESGNYDVLQTPSPAGLTWGLAPDENTITDKYPIVVHAYDPNAPTIQGPRVLFSRKPATGNTGPCIVTGSCLWLVTQEIGNPGSGDQTDIPDPTVF